MTARRGPSAARRGPLTAPLVLSCRAALPAAASLCQEPSQATLPSCAAQPSCAAFAEPRRPAEPRRTAEPRCPSACPASTSATTATAATAAMAEGLRGLQLTLTFGLTTCSSFFSVTLGMGYPFSITRPVSLLHLLPRARAPPCLRAALLVARHPSLPAMASLSVLTFDHEGRPIQFDTWLDDLQLYLLSDSRDSVSLFDHTSGASLAPPAIADSVTRSQWLTRDAAARLASLDPTDLTVDLLEQHHLAAEKSVVAVGAACGTPRTRFFEGCSPSPLAPSYASAAAVDILGTADAGVVAAVVAAVGEVVVAPVGVVAIEVEMFRGEVLAVAKGNISNVGARPLHPSTFVSGLLSVGRLGVVLAARMSFARVNVLVTHAGSLTLSIAASPA
ncbi:unnamed protein product [Closterium sp. NIES-54]